MKLRDNYLRSFGGFFEVQGRTVVNLSTIISEQLSKVRLDQEPNKLSWQTYSGASVMRGKNYSLQNLTIEWYLLANYLYCYAHQGILIIQISHHQSLQDFFCNLQFTIGNHEQMANGNPKLKQNKAAEESG